MRATKQILADALHVTGWQSDPPRNYIEALRARLSQHDGCSRFGPKDSLLLKLYAEIPAAITRAKHAIIMAESYDEQREALINLLSVIGEQMPDCNCSQEHRSHHINHAADCPAKAWEDKQ